MSTPCSYLQWFIIGLKLAQIHQQTNDSNWAFDGDLKNVAEKKKMYACK